MTEQPPWSTLRAQRELPLTDAYTRGCAQARRAAEAPAPALPDRLTRLSNLAGDLTAAALMFAMIAGAFGVMRRSARWARR